jgi:hypothetical protein
MIESSFRPETKRQHFVPQSYLASFSIRRKRQNYLEVFDKIEERQFSANTTNIAVSRYFNRVEMHGERPDFVETEIAKWESAISLSLQEVLSSQSLSVKEQHDNLVLLASLLTMRTPKFRRFFKGLYEQVYSLVTEVLLSSRDRWENSIQATKLRYPSEKLDVDYDTLKRQFDGGAFEITADIPTGHYVKQELSHLADTIELLMARRWGLLHAPNDTGGFITSDHPLMLTWTRPTPLQYTPGLALEHTAVTLPLSPKLCLVGTFEDCSSFVSLQTESVARINGTSVLWADRQVYAKNTSFVYAFDHCMRPRKASELLTDLSHLRRRNRGS